MALKKEEDFTLPNSTLRQCTKCGQSLPLESFPRSRSPLSKELRTTFCSHCADTYLKENDYSWDAADLLCQLANIPFDVKQWDKIVTANPKGGAFKKYANIYANKSYSSLDWKETYLEHCRLRDSDELSSVSPTLSELQLQQLREFWGSSYDDEGLHYLQSMYDNILRTQNINSEIQSDLAKKLCKISFEFEKRIENGDDIDKIAATYEKTIKTAGFTPQNAKNANDFDTVGELFIWFEKAGWLNQFYDNVTRDVVDETIKNIEAWNQRLYINETNIAEDINRRSEQLARIAQLENQYDTVESFEADRYEDEGYAGLFKEEEDFVADLGGPDDSI